LACEPTFDEVELLPPAAALDEGLVEDETLAPGHWQLLPIDALVEPLAGEPVLAEVVPLDFVVSIDCELVEPLVLDEGALELPPAAALELGCVLLALGWVDEVPPVAALLAPVPLDCEVLAP